MAGALVSALMSGGPAHLATFGENGAERAHLSSLILVPELEPLLAITGQAVGGSWDVGRVHWHEVCW